MQNELKNQKLKNIICEISEELKSVSGEHTGYYKKLNGQSSLGIFSNKKDKKSLAEDYYQYASALAAAISKAEHSLSTLSNIIIDADRNGRQDEITLCDTLLTRYGEFKKAVSHFASQNERLLTKESVSSSEMNNILSEFGYKLNYFKDFLNERKF